MTNISFAEERRVAVEFEGGAKLTFSKELALPEDRLQYRMVFIGGGSNLVQSYLNLPSMEDMLGFLSSVQLNMPAEDLQAIRVQLSQ